MGPWECLAQAQAQLYSSSKGGRGWLIIFRAVLITVWSTLLSVTVQLAYHTYAVLQCTLLVAVVKGHKQFLVELVLPEKFQEVESLLCLLNWRCGVCTSGQVLLYRQKTLWWFRWIGWGCRGCRVGSTTHSPMGSQCWSLELWRYGRAYSHTNLFGDDRGVEYWAKMCKVQPCIAAFLL